MSDLEEKINAVLGDPQQMQEITRLAKSLMGGSEKEAAPDMAADMGIDPKMLQRMGQLIGKSRENQPQQQALLEAMKPYLSEKRRSKMDRAIKLARLARIARLAMDDTGGDGSD